MVGELFHVRFKTELASYLIGFAVAVIGVSLTAWATVSQLEFEREKQQAVLKSYAEQAMGTIRSRFAQYETILQAGRAIFAGSEFVSRDEWRKFVLTLGINERFSGLAGLAWIPRVTPPELDHLRERAAAAGVDSFRIRPRGERSVYCPILYNEPIENNANSLGNDVCQVPATGTALASSRESGQVQFSEPLTLIQPDGSEDSGYALLVWVSGTAEQHAGWVGAPLPIREIFEGALIRTGDTQLRVFDISGRQERQVVYETRQASRTGKSRIFDTDTVELQRSLSTGGRQWRLEFSQSVPYGVMPWTVLGSGLAITGLLAAILIILVRTRSRAIRLADDMTRAYRESEELLSSITNNIFEGIYRGVPGKGLAYANDALARMFGFDTPEEMVSHAGPILYADPARREELRNLLVRQGYYKNEEVEFIRPDGSRFIGVNNAIAVYGDDGNIRYFDGAVSDITERKEAEEKIHYLAHYDSLTGLPNRTMLYDRIEQGIAHVDRNHTELALLFLDLDRFKTVNDSLGHGVGDRLLAAAAERIKKALRGHDTVSRQGGDEFLVALLDVDEESSSRVASKIMQLVSEPFIIEGHELRITPSIGIALYPRDGQDAEMLIRNADAAMYYAKEKGRATFQYFTSELNARAYERLSLETDLRHALERNEFELHYQPQIRLSDGRIVGGEALIRWNHPERGMVSPGTFIPVAEQSGLIIDIGDWVVDEACRQQAAWRAAGLSYISVAVNVSALQFWRGTIDQSVRAAMERHGVAAERLELELTESVIMHDFEATSRVIHELNELGVSLSIDDFGTGYSSLSYLKQLRIDKLKIDQSFVQDVATDPDDAAIVSAILSMARDLKLVTVAEGVETLEQAEYMKNGGCDLAQGFYFSKPLKPDDFGKLLQEETSFRLDESGE